MDKTHVAFDIKSRQVVSVKVSDEKTQYSQKAEELIETASQKAKYNSKRVKKVIADRRYDTQSIQVFA